MLNVGAFCPVSRCCSFVSFSLLLVRSFRDITTYKTIFKYFLKYIFHHEPVSTQSIFLYSLLAYYTYYDAATVLQPANTSISDILFAIAVVVGYSLARMGRCILEASPRLRLETTQGRLLREMVLPGLGG